MAQLFAKCEVCKKPRFFIRKRQYFIDKDGVENSKIKLAIVSKSSMCGKCYKGIKRVLAQQ